MKKRLTHEEAKKLKFPCLLEVWDNDAEFKDPLYKIVVGIRKSSRFIDIQNFDWDNAALPSPKIAEAMRKQFGVQSEYPQRMLVWNNDESKAEPRIIIADLGKKSRERYISVCNYDESRFKNGEEFEWCSFMHAKPLSKPNPIAEEIAELRQRIKDLEAKQNQ